MKATGITVEYNPFHNGHIYHLSQVKALHPDDVVIAVMSGDFVQRGEPAVFDKWIRTECALANGIDIVVELPHYYSCQNAEIFARGAIMTLDAMKCSSIVFGSESADEKKLIKIAKMVETHQFKEKIREILKQGVSYPSAYEKALDIKNKLGPNDILGVEYIKSIIKIGSKIKFDIIKREKVGYYEKNGSENVASATKIREDIMIGNDISAYIPKNTCKIVNGEIKNKKYVFLKDLYPLIRYEIISHPDKMMSIQDVEIGFENKLYDSAKRYHDFEDFFKDITSKRYSLGRLQRILIHILLGCTREMTLAAKECLPFVKILGFNEKGKKYLAQTRKKEKQTKIITTYRTMTKEFSEEEKMFALSSKKADMIYRMMNGREERKIPIIRGVK